MGTSERLGSCWRNRFWVRAGAFCSLGKVGCHSSAEAPVRPHSHLGQNAECHLPVAPPMARVTAERAHLSPWDARSTFGGIPGYRARIDALQNHTAKRNSLNCRAKQKEGNFRKSESSAVHNEGTERDARRLAGCAAAVLVVQVKVTGQFPRLSVRRTHGPSIKQVGEPAPRQPPLLDALERSFGPVPARRQHQEPCAPYHPPKWSLQPAPASCPGTVPAV